MHKREIEEKAREIKDRREPLVAKGQEAQRQIQFFERQLSNLDSATGQQELKLQQISADTFKAYKWLLDNGDKFEQEVFGPPIVTCSVTDPKFADAVESLFQRTQFTTFTTQNRNDFRTMQRELITNMRLHDISIQTCSQSLERMKPPMADDQLRQLGFDGWAKDFLSGPDPVIAMLCSDKNLHSTPIAVRDVSDDVFARLANSPLSSWVSGRNSYQITRRREYGPDAKSTRVAQVKPAKVWTSQPVDQNLKREYQENITQWQGERESINSKLESEKSLLLKLRDDLEQTMKETVCDAPLTRFQSLTYLSCRKKLRPRKTKNKPPILSTEPFRKRSVCQISTSSSGKLV